MVDLSPTPRVSAILPRLAAFIEREIPPLAQEVERRLGERGGPGAGPIHLDADGTLSPVVWEARREVAKRSAVAGFYNLHLPEEVGGGGLSRTEMFFVEEAVYARGLGLTPAILAWTEGPSPMMLHMNAEQRRRFLDPLMRGAQTAAFALTEQGAGSDILGIKTRAVREADEWRLTGAKSYITSARYCDMAAVIAVTDPGAGTRSLSLFMVEADRPGFRRGPTYRTLMDDGLTGEIILDDVRVPDANRVGEAGQGFQLALTYINWRRLGRGGMCSGWGKYLLDLSIEYARARKAFGKPIGNLQAIQHMLAEMYLDWYSARSLSLAAQWELDNLGPYKIPLSREAVRLIATVKLANDQAFYRIADRAVQLHGAYGLTKDNPAETLFRIARNLRIPAGTDEIQRNAIARGLGLGET
jgi:alkylation response protein AidB-like acyl-CoA dehydrogenase